MTSQRRSRDVTFVSVFLYVDGLAAERVVCASAGQCLCLIEPLYGFFVEGDKLSVVSLNVLMCVCVCVCVYVRLCA